MFNLVVTPQTTFGNNVNNSKFVKRVKHLDTVFRSNSDLQIVEQFVAKMVQEAQRLVPVRTGNLKGAIKMQKSGTGFRFYVDTAKAPYGPYVEFGTRRQKSKPFFVPAIERNKDPLRQALINYYRSV